MDDNSGLTFPLMIGIFAFAIAYVFAANKLITVTTEKVCTTLVSFVMRATGKTAVVKRKRTTQTTYYALEFTQGQSISWGDRMGLFIFNSATFMSMLFVSVILPMVFAGLWFLIYTLVKETFF